MRRTPIQRWARMVELPPEPGACWRWTGFISPHGYGRVWDKTRGPQQAHRMGYEFFHERLLRAQVLDHLCRNRWCVNPLHLEVVTDKENIRRGEGVPAINHRKRHCMRGHPFDEANTYHHPNGAGRRCRTCAREVWGRNRRARKCQ